MKVMNKLREGFSFALVMDKGVPSAGLSTHPGLHANCHEAPWHCNQKADQPIKTIAAKLGMLAYCRGDVIDGCRIDADGSGYPQ